MAAREPSVPDRQPKHRTSNAPYSIAERPPSFIRCWLLVVHCWMFWLRLRRISPFVKKCRAKCATFSSRGQRDQQQVFFEFQTGRENALPKPGRVGFASLARWLEQSVQTQAPPPAGDLAARPVWQEPLPLAAGLWWCALFTSEFMVNRVHRETRRLNRPFTTGSLALFAGENQWNPVPVTPALKRPVPPGWPGTLAVPFINFSQYFGTL